jgi:NhaA family Na+:H+ antiporter
MAHQHALSHHATTAAPAARRHAHLFVRFAMDRFLLLPLGAAIALVWANTAAESYFRFAETLAFPVNDIGMTLFLALIAQEIFEALMPGGALHTWRRWGAVIVAAAGGLAGSAFVYLAWVALKHEEVLAQAWPIACSIDIVAGYYVLKAIFRRSSALPFLLLMAILTDAVGLIVLATWPPLAPNHLVGALLLMVALTLAAVMRKAKARSFWPYLAIAGPISWFAFYWADVYPALALLPLVPFLPHEPRHLDLFAEAPDNGAVHHAEHEWNDVVQVVAFLFALVNAGVQLRQYDTGTWALLMAALVGRPLGILGSVALAVAAGLHLPRRIGWRELSVIAWATSSGFTVALFFATGFLPLGAVLEQIKLGALVTALGALSAVGIARWVHIGRFARQPG